MSSQLLLPGYQKSENDLVEEALSRPLAMKIGQAIVTLRRYMPAALRLDSRGFLVCYSGGKDSGPQLKLAEMAGVPFYAEYNDTTIDPPELRAFIRRHHPEVHWTRPKTTLFKRVTDRGNGPPTRLARWCCREFKEGNGKGRLKLIGVRVAESVRRAKLWRTYVPDKHGDGGFVCPICYWTDEDIWEFHRLMDIPYCSLYDEGYKRLGCVGCPLSGSSGQKRDFARWPQYEHGWRLAIKRHWEQWHGVAKSDGTARYTDGFARWEDMWEWWISGERKDEGLSCQGEFLFANDRAEGDEL